MGRGVGGGVCGIGYERQSTGEKDISCVRMNSTCSFLIASSGGLGAGKGVGGRIL